MPYPSQIDREQLIQTAWEMVEAEGSESLSLGKLAAKLGIKAPSLYNHIQNKAALIRAVNETTQRRLFAELDAIAPVDDPQGQLLAIAHAYRAFALAHPVTYTLAFSTMDADARPDPDVQERDALLLQAIIIRLIPDKAQSLAMLRGLWALIHGFVMLEIHAQFRRGGSLDEAFTASVQAFIRGIGD